MREMKGNIETLSVGGEKLLKMFLLYATENKMIMTMEQNKINAIILVKDKVNKRHTSYTYNWV